MILICYANYVEKIEALGGKIEALTEIEKN